MFLIIFFTYELHYELTEKIDRKNRHKLQITMFVFNG